MTNTTTPRPSATYIVSSSTYNCDHCGFSLSLAEYVSHDCAELLGAMRAEAVMVARCAERVDTGAGMELTVNHLSWPVGTELADIEAGAPAAEVTLTADGRRYEAGWHSGPEAEWIYVERWTAAGREFHGWIDSVSRRLLQAG